MVFDDYVHCPVYPLSIQSFQPVFCFLLWQHSTLSSEYLNTFGRVRQIASEAKIQITPAIELEWCTPTITTTTTILGVIWVGGATAQQYFNQIITITIIIASYFNHIIWVGGATAQLLQPQVILRDQTSVCVANRQSIFITSSLLSCRCHENHQITLQRDKHSNIKKTNRKLSNICPMGNKRNFFRCEKSWRW